MLFQQNLRKFSFCVSCFMAVFASSTCLAIPIPGTSQIRMDDFGNTYAVWGDQSDGVVLYATKPVGQPWEAAVPLSDTSLTSYNPILRTNTLGDCVAIWLAIDPTWGTTAIVGSFKPQGSSSWAPATVLSNSNELLGDSISVTINDAGAFAACWDSDNLDTNVSIIATRPGTISGGWGASTIISQ